MKIIRSLLISLCITTMTYVTWYHMPTKLSLETIRTTHQSSFVANYSYSELLDSYKTLEQEVVQDAIIATNITINFPLYFIFLGVIIGIYSSIYFLLDVFNRLLLLLKNNSLLRRIFKRKRTVVYEKNDN